MYNLYDIQTAMLRVEYHERQATIQKRVRKGCSL